MRFVVITHAKHLEEDGKVYSYAPYVKEMNLWTNYVSECIIVAPKVQRSVSNIDLAYSGTKIILQPILSFSLISVLEVLRTFFLMPYLLFKIITAMRKADHIHLRCPGNMGLLGCIAQVFFPNTPKTAKYAGNWDPNAKQPFTYRIQKWILANTFLTRNMKVLVYGDWENQTKNIKSFFTATYPKEVLSNTSVKLFESPFKFLFIGSLAKGKRPLYAIQLVEKLKNREIDCSIDIYGDGAERAILETYISEHKLSEFVTLHGNQNAKTIVDAYKNGHFLILPSRSEGWPKVVAEAMFWGLIPLVTPISCVPWMLQNETRGKLLCLNLKKDSKQIELMLQNKKSLEQMSLSGQEWSHHYTLDYFESEIEKLLTT